VQGINTAIWLIDTVMVPKDWTLDSVASPSTATNTTRAVLTPSTDLGSKDPAAPTTTTTTTDSKAITGTNSTSAPAPKSGGNSAASALPASLLAALLAALALLL
jgi:hypothetical protein